MSETFYECPKCGEEANSEFSMCRCGLHPVPVVTDISNLAATWHSNPDEALETAQQNYEESR